MSWPFNTELLHELLGKAIIDTGATWNAPLVVIGISAACIRRWPTPSLTLLAGLPNTPVLQSAMYESGSVHKLPGICNLPPRDRPLQPIGRTSPDAYRREQPGIHNRGISVRIGCNQGRAQARQGFSHGRGYRLG
jgi:hypothetical protein